MSEIEKYGSKTFDNIRKFDQSGNEYWEARELQKVLGYSQWRRFENTINRAKTACENSKINIIYHFADVGKMVQTGDSKRIVSNYKLSRYACYLIVQNGDSRKPIIALGQTYFAIQTRKQELSEDEKRIYNRALTKKENLSLNKEALKAGVKNFDKFHNYGYKGLYNGETANDIAKRKKLRYREDILDNMCSDELIINLFRISQTEQKIKNNNINNQQEANVAHLNVGKELRRFIKKQGGTMPEDFPNPKKSLKSFNKIGKIK